jgi:hypothetical protein
VSTIEAHTPFTQSADLLLARAGAVGFELRTRFTDTGQTVWEWCRGEEPRPQFVTERVARHWMHRWLEQFEDAPG